MITGFSCVHRSPHQPSLQIKTSPCSKAEETFRLRDLPKVHKKKLPVFLKHRHPNTPNSLLSSFPFPLPHQVAQAETWLSTLSKTLTLRLMHKRDSFWVLIYFLSTIYQLHKVSEHFIMNMLNASSIASVFSFIPAIFSSNCAETLKVYLSSLLFFFARTCFPGL